MGIPAVKGLKLSLSRCRPWLEGTGEPGNPGEAQLSALGQWRAERLQAALVGGGCPQPSLSPHLCPRSTSASPSVGSVSPQQTPWVVLGTGTARGSSWSRKEPTVPQSLREAAPFPEGRSCQCTGRRGWKQSWGTRAGACPCLRPRDKSPQRPETLG